MQRFKKFMAVALAATMVVGSSITVFAAENEGSTNGEGTSEGHVNKELINMVLPTVPDDSTPFAYTMDPERLIQETDAAKYGDNVTFPDANGDTGVYFLTAENTYSNNSNTLQAINKSSAAVTLTVKVKTTAGSDKDIALATSSTVASGDGVTPDLYLGLKVGNDTKIVSATEQTVTKTIAGVTDNFEVAVVEGNYVYREKADATTWKAMNISMTGAVSALAIAADTTAPTVNVTWSYAKAADGAELATDAVDYSTTPAEAAPSITLASVTAEEDTDAVWTYSLGSGDLAATAISGITFNGADAKSAFDLTSAGQIKLASATVKTIPAGSYSYTVTFDDDDATTGTITLVIE